MRLKFVIAGTITLVLLNALLLGLDRTPLVVVPFQLFVAGLAGGPLAAILVAFLPAIIFFAWGVWPRKSPPSVRWPSLAFAVATATVATTAAFGVSLFSSSAGLSLPIFTIDLGFAAALTWAAFVSARSHTLGSATLFHWLLLAGIATYAFPYRGEFP
jgi:hypothetical protein